MEMSSIDTLKRIFDKFCTHKYEFKSLKLSYGSYMNYVEIKKDTYKTSPGYHPRTLVLAHGYALGLGFFFSNFDRLLDHSDASFDRIIAIDWPGMGHSGREYKFTPKRSVLSRNEGNVVKSVDFFIDAIEVCTAMS